MKYLDEMELMELLLQLEKMLVGASDGYEKAIVKEEIFRLQEVWADVREIQIIEDQDKVERILSMYE